MAGALALLAYVEDFIAHGVFFPEAPEDWHSDHEFMVAPVDDTIIDKFYGKPIELPFAFWILRNVRAALKTLAVQS